MFDVFEKILIGILALCVITLLTCYGVIFYKVATGDDSFFAAQKAYIMNKDFCKEDK